MSPCSFSNPRLRAHGGKPAFALLVVAPGQPDKLNKQNKQLENPPYHPYN
jgi:hypothetical protein